MKKKLQNEETTKSVYCHLLGSWSNRLKSRLSLPVTVRTLSVYTLCNHTPTTPSFFPVLIIRFFFSSITRAISQTLEVFPPVMVTLQLLQIIKSNQGCFFPLYHSPNMHSTCFVFTSAGVMWTMALHGTAFSKSQKGL